MAAQCAAYPSIRRFAARQDDEAPKCRLQFGPTENGPIAMTWQSRSTFAQLPRDSLTAFCSPAALSANPGRVRDIVPVPLPYERTLEARETPEFVSLAARLRRTLETC